MPGHTYTASFSIRAFGRGDECDVTQTFLVGLFGLEIPLEQVWDNRVGMLAVSGYFSLPFSLGADIFCSHQANNPVFTHLKTSAEQFSMDPGATIGLPTFGMNGPDFCDQFLVDLCPFTGRAVSPGVVAAS